MSPALTHAVFHVLVITQLTFEPGAGINVTPDATSLSLVVKHTQSLNTEKDGPARTGSPRRPKPTSYHATSYNFYIMLFSGSESEMKERRKRNSHRTPSASGFTNYSLKSILAGFACSCLFTNPAQSV